MADLYYIESGYYDDGYFVYTANADSAINSEFSQSCDAELIAGGVLVEATGSFNTEGTTSVQASKIADFVASFQSEFTQAATISHIHGADLFAFTEAAIAVQVDRIRDNNTAASDIFNIATDFVRFRTADAGVDAVLSAIINGLRSRDTITETQAAFSFDCINDRIKFAEASINSESSIFCDATEITPFIEGEATLASNFTVSSTVERTQSAVSSLEIVSNLTTIISHIEGADLFAFTNASLSIEGERFRDSQITTSNVFDIATDFVRYRDLAADASDIFISQVDAQRNRNTNIETQIAFSFDCISSKTTDIQSSHNGEFSVTAIISHIEGADLTAFSDAQVSTNADRIRYNTISAVSEFSSNIGYQRTREISSQINFEIQITCVVDRIRNDSSSSNIIFNSSLTAVKILSLQSNINSAFATVVNIDKVIRITMIAFNLASLAVIPFVRKSAVSNQSVQSTQITEAVKVTDILLNANANSNISCLDNRFRDNVISISNIISINTDNGRIRNQTSQVFSQFNLNAIVGKQQDIDLFAFSNNSLITDAVVIRSAESIQQSQSTVQSIIGVIKPMAASANLSFAFIADNTRLKFSESNIQAFGSVLNIYDVIPAVKVVMGGAFDTDRPYAEDGYVDDDYTDNFLTIANYIVDNLQQLSSVSALLVGADVVAEGAALLANGGTLNVSAVKTVSVTSNNTIDNILLSNAVKQIDIISNINSEITLTANVGTQEDTFLTVFNDVALTVNVVKTVNISLALTNNTVFNANTSDSLNLRGKADIISVSTQTVSGNRIRFGVADIQALAFQLADGDVGIQIVVNKTITSTLNVNVEIIRTTSSAITSTTNITSVVDRTRLGQITIASAMTFVSEVRDLRLEEIEYRIPGEGWEYRIVGENREYDIIGETRLRDITSESRERRIDGETRIYIIE